MIKEIQVQRDLATFKKKTPNDKSGEIDLGHWRAFKKRNTHLIWPNRGQKYALDSANWTTFANLKQMCDQVYDEMEDARVTVKWSTQIW